MTIRIDQQLNFLIEADKLKSVQRSNVLMDGSRSENSAEHSWHIALWALCCAPENIDIGRAIKMLILHDIVEIDAGDHPIHLPHKDQTDDEQRAADRIFGLLPTDQAHALRSLWDEFEAGKTPDAAYAKAVEHAQPMFQSLCADHPQPESVTIIRANLATGRARDLATRWPDAYSAATARLAGETPPPSIFEQRLTFMAEADKLKSVLRGTMLNDNSRHENSGEHSWHIALYALVTSEHSIRPVNVDRVIKMLLLHDLVEIDAGDVPIHSAAARDASIQNAAEQKAADRLFGILPTNQCNDFRTLWDEFEAAATDDSIFAKSIDRVQPVVSNLEAGGASWIQYNVTRAQVQSRVGEKVMRGAPAIWDALKTRIDIWFDT